MIQHAPHATDQPQPAPAGTPRPVTPHVRQLAAERGMDLEALRLGAGNGRVRAEEVEQPSRPVSLPGQLTDASTPPVPHDTGVVAAATFRVDAAVAAADVLLAGVRALHHHGIGPVRARLVDAEGTRSVDDAADLTPDGLVRRLTTGAPGNEGHEACLVDLAGSGLLSWHDAPAGPGSLRMSVGDVERRAVGVPVAEQEAIGIRGSRLVTVALGADLAVHGLSLVGSIARAVTTGE